MSWKSLSLIPKLVQKHGALDAQIWSSSLVQGQLLTLCLHLTSRQLEKRDGWLKHFRDPSTRCRGVSQNDIAHRKVGTGLSKILCGRASEILDIHQFLPAQHHHIIPDIHNEPRCSYTIFEGTCSRAQCLCFTGLPAAEHIIETAAEKTIRHNIDSDSDSEPDTAETCLTYTGKHHS
jgi:hypothetical protein